MGMGTNNNNSTPSTATTTTSLERNYFEVSSSKPQHLPPHNQNGRLRQLQLLLLELLLRSRLLHLRQISKSFHQPTFGSIIRQHNNVTASPRRSPSSPQHGKHVNGLSARVTRHHGLQEWIEGQIDEDTRLKMEGKETSVTEMHFRFYLLLMNPEDFRS